MAKDERRELARQYAIGYNAGLRKGMAEMAAVHKYYEEKIAQLKTRIGMGKGKP